jgi:hypothetical protein
MSKYLIEVHHDSGDLECQRAVELFHITGSHFLTNADWGCLDGVHKAWFIMDANDKNEAIRIVPPAYRENTVITQLNKFTPTDFEDMRKHHNA